MKKIITYKRRPNYWNGQPGRRQKLCEEEEEGMEEVPKTQQRKEVKSSNFPKQQFKHEWAQNKTFYNRFTGYLEKKIKIVLCESSVECFMKQKTKKFSVENLPTWEEGDVVMKDCKGRPLLYYLRNALGRPFNHMSPVEEGTRVLQQFTKAYQPPRPKASDPRHKGWEHREGHGVHHLALWKAIGHPNDPAVLSRDMLRSGEKNRAVAIFFCRFTPVTQAVGALFECIDSQNYDRYNKHFTLFADEGNASVMKTTTRNCFLGMTILTGVCCKPHRDTRDASDGWVADVTFGEFEGGFFQVPQLGYQFYFKPGDVIFMRSSLLQHSVTPTTSGKRFGVVYFTHDKNFEERMTDTI